MRDTTTSRKTPAYWVREMRSCIKQNQPKMNAFVRFCNWYRGDMRDTIDPDAVPNIARPWEAGLDNLHTFVTDAAIAQMFFRNPRFSIRTPSGKPTGVFTPGLARVEAAMLNDTIEQIGYFRRARRRLLDARNGPYGILKITYDCNIVVDMEAVEEGRAEASLENQSLLAGNVKAMHAKESQLHSCHIEKHKEMLAEMERGTIAATKSLIKHVKKHIKIHESMRTTERPTETSRDEAVVVRRVNPLDFFYDVTVDDIADARWYAHTYLMRKNDVLLNEDYEKEARDAVAESKDRWVRSDLTLPSTLRTEGTFDGSEIMVRCNEVIDLVDGTVREFFEGGQVMARERPYEMRSIQKSGPYSILMFKPDPQEASGICPPVAWEAEQAAATAMASAHVSAAIELARSRGVYNPNFMDKETVEQIVQGGGLTWIPIKNMPNDGDIRKVMGPAPELEISDQSIGVKMATLSRVMQSSGLGAQRALAGDRSETATGAAITAGAADAIAEDGAAIHDDAMAYDGKMIIRLTRKCVPKATVVEVVGSEAMVWYPETWADRDIENDRAIYVVPGSSRRRSTAVDTKMTLEAVTVASALPAMAGPAGQSLLLEAMRRVFDDQGISGLDWDAVDQEQQVMAMAQEQLAAGGEGAPPGEEGGPAPPEPSEAEAPSDAGQLQGVQNYFGGRFPTGASNGDRPRVMRGGKTA